LSIANFIPKIWSAKIFTRLQKVLVFGARCNRNYEGEVTYGNSVRINEVGPITINDYTREGAVTWETLEDVSKVMPIDQEKYFAFTVDSVDRVQTNPDVFEAATREATYAMADEIDQNIAALWSDAGVTGSLGTTTTAIGISSGNIIEYLGIVNQKLNEANCPTEGRWGILPPWMIQKLEMAQVNKDTDNTKVMLRGYNRTALGIDIYMSNNVVETTSTTFARCMFGTNDAITLAFQIQRIEAVSREDYFDDGLKGLTVWGRKVVRPNALACLIASRHSG
jgi:hypothetical protein